MDDNNQILIYQSEDGSTHIEVKFTGDSVWLTQQQLCDLFQTSKSNVSEHIKHIFEERGLDKDSVVRKFRTTAADGKNYEVIYYNLDMIISLGYRVKSSIATHFRRWATERLKEYIIKSFTIDDERLKGNGGGAQRPPQPRALQCEIRAQAELLPHHRALNRVRTSRFASLSRFCGALFLPFSPK